MLPPPPFFLISIHALREEGDSSIAEFFSAARQFLSTPSARRATGGFGVGCRLQIISIHALREEGDQAFSFAEVEQVIFLSTPSARRATVAV